MSIAVKRPVTLVGGPRDGLVHEVEDWVRSLVCPTWISRHLVETWTYREGPDRRWVGAITGRQFFPVIENPDPDFKPETHECDCDSCGWDNW